MKNRILQLFAVWAVSTLSAASAQFEISPETLSRRLADLEAQIETLKHRQYQEQAEWDAFHDTRQRHRRQLAQQVLDAAFERERLKRRRDHIGRELDRQRLEAEQLDAATKKLAEHLAAMADGMDLHLAESPDAGVFQTPDIHATRESKNDADRQAMAELAIQWLTLFDRLGARAGQIHIDRTAIYTVDGTLEQVDLLSIGRIGFAYRTVNDGRIGLAAASGSDATGYRWNESLDRTSRRHLEELFSYEQQSGQILRIPLDVTGRITVEAAIRNTGRLAALRQGGFVMIPLLAVAVLAAILMAERFWFLSRAGRGGGSAAEKVLSACRKQDYALAEKQARAAGGVVAGVLGACLQRRQQGQHAMEDSIQEQLLHETPPLERFLTGIAVLGAVAPLLGLLGTVTGIIQTFAVITAFGNAQPAAMAGGISEALVTTAAGLTIAIPILLAHSLLSGRADRIVSDAEKHAAALLNVLGEQS